VKYSLLLGTLKVENLPSASLNVLPTSALQSVQALAGIEVAIIGYGNQGHAHALNLRDSGVSVVIGANPGKGSKAALSDGFDCLSIGQAVQRAALVVVALPDETHQKCWCELIAPCLRPGTVVGFLHGFSVHHGLVNAPAEIGVVMLAPKGPGHALRARFTQGLGIPALFAVHQHGLDAHHTRALTLAWAVGIGCGRAAVIETSFAHEAQTDLFGEQAVLCGGVMALMQTAFHTLVRAGYPPELAYMECCQELKQLADLVFEQGLSGMRKAISNTAEFGAFVASEQLADDSMRGKFSALLADIQSGAFGVRFQSDAAAGFPWMQARRAAADADAIEQAGEKVRAWMPWLHNKGKTR